MKKKVKFMVKNFRKQTISDESYTQLELVMLFDDKIVYHNEEFTDALECRDIDLEQYKSWETDKKLEEAIADTLDGYYYNGVEVMDNYFNYITDVNLEGYELIDEKEYDADILKNLVERETKDNYFKKCRDHMLEKLALA